MPFALDSSPDISEVSEAINYLLANFSPNLSADPSTGQITGPVGEVAGYLYKYMAIKYADSFDGSLNFSNIPTGRLYYGARNNNDPAESSNPADYIWYKVSGGFGGAKSLWYISTGGRQIQFAASVSAPDTGWLVDSGSSIDLDVVTSGNIPVIAESFFAYFVPNTLQVPRTGGPLAPVFTSIIPKMYATDKGSVVPFSDAQTDTGVTFINGTWRIGNSSTTGNADISYTNLTIGSPTDAGDFAEWPIPTAMPSSPAYITVPVRYKNSLGVVSQAGVASVQLVYVDPGLQGDPGPTIDITGYTSFVQNPGGAFTPTTATLSAITTNVTSPTYIWVISGATPTSSTASSVVITPNSSASSVNVTLTVNGSNLTSPISKTMNLPVVYDGVEGVAGSNGVMSAFPSIYIWTGSSTPPTRPLTTSTYTWATGAYTAPSGWATTAPSNTTAGNFLWSITVPLNASATATTATLDWTNTGYPIRAIAFNGFNGTDGTDGTNGIRTAIMDVYQWSVTAPTTFPSGTSTYTWATGQFTAPGLLNGWSLVPPAAVLGQTLWIARTVYADNNTSPTTSITWSASQSNPVGAAGTNGTRTAFLEMYQWAASTPTLFPSGASTYTWATGVFTAPTTPNGWSITPGASTTGYKLYGCSVSYSDTNTTSTSSVNWTTSTAYVVGAAGTNGSNGAATFVVTRSANDSSPPTNAEVNSVIGRDPVAGDIVTVSYNSGNNAVVYRFTTTWVTQATYLTGNLIVDGTITGNKISAGTIWTNNLQVGSVPTVSGTTMTGSGATINSSGTFALGNSTGNITYNGSVLTLNGQIVAMGNITGGTITSAAGFGTGTITIGSTSNLLQVSRTGSTTTPAVYINDTGTASTEALYIVTNSTHTPAANTISSSASGNVALYVESTGSSSGSAKFYNTNASKNAWLAPGLYSVYSPSGGGQIKITDGTAPFTGLHEGMMPLTAIYAVGDIVVDDGLFYKLDVTNCLFKVKQSSQANEYAIGIFNTSTPVQETNPTVLWQTYFYLAYDETRKEYVETPGLRLLPQFDLTTLQSTYTVASINAVGEGQVNVCGENGNIQAGDLIVTSSIVGKGMRQDDDVIRSYTVAKARESANFANPTDVQQIACVYLCG